MSIPKSATVLIAGASGAVGPSVVQALCEAGHSVRTFSLDRPLAGAFPQNVDERLGDVILADVPCPAVKRGQLLIRTSRTLVCAGTGYPDASGLRSGCDFYIYIYKIV